MTVVDSWIDLLDPTAEELDAVLPEGVHVRAFERLLQPSVHDDEPRPKLESHGDYLLGVFLIAVVEPDGAMHYQEVDLILTRTRLVTIRKTPSNGKKPYDCTSAQAACREHESLGMVVYHLVDDIAERYLGMVDRLDEAIENLEDGLESWDSEVIRRRLNDIKRDILQIRRTLGPFRELTRQIIDNRLDVDGEEVFPKDVEINFSAAHDKFLRATDGLEVARDLLSGVRDYYQTLLSNRQNEIGQRMAAIASMLLLPTFIVGLYGQNFVDIPETHWRYGYLYSWGLIVGLTIAQFVYFRRKKWL
jgi:magnesium transporter